MILWYIGMAWAIVWLVFRDPRIDLRVLAAGALAPLVIDLPAGEPRYGHTLLAAAAVLGAVVVLTLGRRPWRRSAVMFPVGMLIHLLLSGTFGDQELFWWPAFGTDFPDGDLVPGALAVVVREVVGGAAAVWMLRARHGAVVS